MSIFSFLEFICEPPSIFYFAVLVHQLTLALSSMTFKHALVAYAVYENLIQSAIAMKLSVFPLSFIDPWKLDTGGSAHTMWFPSLIYLPKEIPSYASDHNSF